MPKIQIHNQTIEYTLRSSARARKLTMTIYQDGRFVITVPTRARSIHIEKSVSTFIKAKSKWILDKINYFKQHPIPVATRRRHTKAEYLKHKLAALRLATERLEHFNQVYGFKYNNITIRNQKSRWGSCSKKGNLSFNYKIVLLPQELSDYIIVHELCHLGEFNHSKKFWNLVAKTIPNHHALSKRLHTMQHHI